MRNFANYRLRNSSCEISRRMLHLSALPDACFAFSLAIQTAPTAPLLALTMSFATFARNQLRKAANAPNSNRTPEFHRLCKGQNFFVVAPQLALLAEIREQPARVAIERVGLFMQRDTLRQAQIIGVVYRRIRHRKIRSVK